MRLRGGVASHEGPADDAFLLGSDHRAEATGGYLALSLAGSYTVVLASSVGVDQSDERRRRK
jgi:hypothetical protein